MLLRTLLFLLLVAFLVRAVSRLLGGVMRGASGGSTAGPQRPASPPAVKMSPCPVCGTYVVPGKAITAVSGGRTVYLCSETCRARLG